VSGVRGGRVPDGRRRELNGLAPATGATSSYRRAVRVFDEESVGLWRTLMLWEAVHPDREPSQSASASRLSDQLDARRGEPPGDVDCGVLTTGEPSRRVGRKPVSEDDDRLAGVPLINGRERLCALSA
jgi:hypothetical protein